MASQREHRDETHALRVQRVIDAKSRDPDLSISAIVERTGYGRTFVVETLAAAARGPQAEAA